MSHFEDVPGQAPNQNAKAEVGSPAGLENLTRVCAEIVWSYQQSLLRIAAMARPHLPDEARLLQELWAQFRQTHTFVEDDVIDEMVDGVLLITKAGMGARNPQ